MREVCEKLADERLRLESTNRVPTVTLQAGIRFRLRQSLGMGVKFCINGGTGKGMNRLAISGRSISHRSSLGARD